MGAAQTIPVQPQSNEGVSVVGEGIVLAPPDVVRITLGADVFDASLASAQAEAARRMDAVVAKLRADGIADADIRTVSFNVTPQYDQQSNQNAPVLRGYQDALPSFDQDQAVVTAQANNTSWADLVEEFRNVRLSTISFFKSLPEEAWSKTGVASDNPFTVRSLAYIIAGHVAHHRNVLTERYL